MFPWQSHTADVAGEFDPLTNRPYYRTVGVSVARQNGKTSLVCTRIARQLIPAKQTVAYTAQDRGLARLKWMEHVDLLMDTPFAAKVDRVEKQRTQECLYMKNGSRYMPVTPTAKKAARSLAVDLAVIDEAYAHVSLGVVSALNPTMITRRHAQLWILSNAGDHTSVLWRHYTDLGRSEINDPDSTICWIEYAADPSADPADPQAQLDANPSLGLPGGVDPEALRAAYKQAIGPGGAGLEVFKREHLNLWSIDSSASEIDAVAWAACGVGWFAPGEQVAYGLEFNEDRATGALIAAGVAPVADEDGGAVKVNVTPLEIIETGNDLEALVRRAAANANATEGVILIQHGSPAASAVPALEKATQYREKGKVVNRVRVVSTTDMTRASADFHDAVKNARLVHASDYRLTDSTKHAHKRKVADAWTWARNAHSNELIAATLARYGVLTRPEPPKPEKAKVESPGRRRVASPRGNMAAVPARRPVGRSPYPARVR